jgi:hypothetical protein
MFLYKLFILCTFYFVNEYDFSYCSNSRKSVSYCGNWSKPACYCRLLFVNCEYLIAYKILTCLIKSHLKFKLWLIVSILSIGTLKSPSTNCFLPTAACYTHSLLFGNCEYLLERKLFFVINLKFIGIILFYSIQTCFKILFCCRSTFLS